MWPSLPNDPPDRVLAREVGGWARWAILPTGLTLGLGLLLAFGSTVDIELVKAMAQGRDFTPDVDAIRASGGWIWGWRLVMGGGPGLLLAIGVAAVTWWLDLSGGWSEVQLRRRAREKTDGDAPWQVLQTMLALEAEGHGRRPEHVLMFARCVPSEAVAPELLEALRVEALTVRDHAIDALKDSDGTFLPETTWAGRTYDPGELRVLAEQVVEAIWTLKMPKESQFEPRA